MIPDPADLLARFTPAAGPDGGELMYRMGRASAPTRKRWKLAVVGLILTNTAALGWLVFRSDPPLLTPDVVTIVVPVPVLLPSVPRSEPSSYGAFRVHDDPDRWPPFAPVAGVVPAGAPLTPLAARRGDID